MKITDLRTGVEYAARRFPNQDIISRIRLLGTTKTADYSYTTGFSGQTVRTKALPAVSIQADGTEHKVAVLPRHIFATWEEYEPTYLAEQEAKARTELIIQQANARITVESVDDSRSPVPCWRVDLDGAQTLATFDHVHPAIDAQAAAEKFAKSARQDLRRAMLAAVHA